MVAGQSPQRTEAFVATPPCSPIDQSCAAIPPVKSSNRRRASGYPPRRVPGCSTFSTRTCCSSAMVRTSPGATGLAGASIRCALMRTCPDEMRRAASVRVFTTRANHSHLSTRCVPAMPFPDKPPITSLSHCAPGFKRRFMLGARSLSAREDYFPAPQRRRGQDRGRRQRPSTSPRRTPDPCPAG